MIPGGIPTDKVQLLKFTQDLVEQCRVSIGVRSAYYRMLHAITETGRYDGTKSLINLMYQHLSRTAALLFSPVELEYKLDFERPYPEQTQKQAKQVARQLTHHWNRRNLDMMFGQGVFESLKYGACILKQWVEPEAGTDKPTYQSKLVMPWQFGVYREDENDINKQVALVETMTLSLPELWYRLHRFPDGRRMYERAVSNAKRGNADYEPSSFFHQILSTNQLNTTGQQGLVRPGGIVNLSNDPVTAIMGPVLAVDVVQMHECWIKDENGYVTIQYIEPDILVQGRLKLSNILVKDSMLQPYRLIQANEAANWFWGRSELVDLVEPQMLLSTFMDDAKRLLGVQIDKFLGFIGEAGLTDEMYGQARMAGFINMPQGAQIQDLTPKIPPEMLPMIKFIIEIINMIGGFPPILQGQGEQGVRAGVHAETLVKTGSPTLRDRALLVERQCAEAADLTLSIQEAKEADYYWTDGTTMEQIEATKFLLTDLPSDWRVMVDSHKSSPIFANESGQLIMAAAKMQIVDGEYVLDNMDFPNKEEAKSRLKKKQEEQAKLLQMIAQRDPQAVEKMLTHGKGGHH